MLAVRARIADTIPAWKRDWSVTVEPFDQLLVGDRPAPVDLRGAGRRRAGAAHRLRQHHQPAAGARRGPAAGDGGARRARRQPRPHRRAAAGRGAGAGHARRRGRRGLAALLIRVAVPLLPPMPFTAEVTLNWRVLGVRRRHRACRVGAGRVAAGDPRRRPARRPPRSTTPPAARRAPTIAPGGRSSPRKSPSRWC